MYGPRDCFLATRRRQARLQRQLAPGAAYTAVIIGDYKVGSVQTARGAADRAHWFTYQWKIGGVDIGGATNATYTPLIGQLGGTLTVVMTPHNPNGAGASKTSAGVTVLAA